MCSVHILRVPCLVVATNVLLTYVTKYTHPTYLSGYVHILMVKSRFPYCIHRYILDTIQDFLYNLGMKPHMHLVEIGIFSLNHVIVRPTKIIKDLGEAST